MASSVRRTLARYFPRTFAPKGALKTPLKIGISKEIVERLPNINKYRIYSALQDYCTGPSYYASLQLGAPRLDLSGAVVDTVTAEQAALAAERLSEFPESVRVKWSSPAKAPTELAPFIGVRVEVQPVTEPPESNNPGNVAP